VSLAAFWGLFAVCVLGFATHVKALIFAAGIAGVVFGARFYFVLYGTWEPGVSSWRMMFDPTLIRARARSTWRLLDLFSPRWIGHTLRATGWNAPLVGSGLAGLLVLDLVLVIFVLPRTTTG
jgi:hypothetical protein